MSSTDTETKLSPAERKKARAAAIKEANKRRVARLKADKERRKAEKEAKKAAKVPDPAAGAKKTEKAAAKEAKAAALASAEKELNPVAKEINTRLEKAAKMEKDADDHRLAAALRLKEAEEKCKEHGIAFKGWSEEHVKGQSYETVRKLLAVGKADDPILALADMRAKNAAANKAHRARKKQAETQRSDPGPIVFDEASGIDPKIWDAGRTELSGVDAMKAAFELLKASEKMEFVEWAALAIGAKLDTGFTADEAAPAPRRRKAA